MLLAVDAEALASTTIEPWQLLLAIVVVIVSWFVSRLARRSVIRITEHLEGMSSEFRTLAGRIAGYAVLFVGFGIALTFLGAQIQPLIAAVILIAVVMALAMRGIAENFAAGILLQTRRPIAIGDEVAAKGYEGIVKEMNGRSVIVETFDGRTVHLPNADLLASPLVNESTRGARRSELEVVVESEAGQYEPDRVISVIAGVPGVLPDPAPAVFVRSIGPEQVTLLIRFWHLPQDGMSVSSALVAALAAEARDHGETVSVAASPSPPPPTSSPPN